MRRYTNIIFNKMRDLKKINKIIEDHERRIRAVENRILLKKDKMSIQFDVKASDNLILSIVNKIGDCKESEKIQINILDKTSMGGKILLCFYISYKYFKNSWLTTGDIEKITSALGTKIAISNVSNKIKSELRKYLESETVRKKGQSTPYRLNRKGVKRFEETINEKNR